ncbi:Rv3235 family protein [Streptomyces sp. NPDC005526]|uniref:Rv3235 family protein n=1 Tax=Streptomyces sp. NPDC005526 TaxID=3156885 RepID=UPI0033BEAC82
MNKVMTRNQRRPGTRPAGRHDSRRPGGGPPRTPGGTPTRTTGGSRPPGPPRATPVTRTRPADTRPPSSPAGPSSLPATRPSSTSATRPSSAPAISAAVPGPSAAAPSPCAAVPGPSVTAPGPDAAAPGRSSADSGRPGACPHPVTAELFADRLLAVLSGQRPVHWMLRHTAGRAYDELAWLADRGPLRARGTRPVVRDIGYYEARPGALEAFARIGAGEQLRAMAFRLEQGRDLRWRCTAVELGGPRMPRPDDD